ncbi:MAG: hypothetical protein A3F68_04275 [Acidobacteria bacterium RIFCSPLOWO2_12_FULL_54_10]|nr:MAG: hypothetical protein A3F68_04275 [Acidobacteria bacterium RIFCSPLOWO2_12_FULL_54_10]
MAKQLIQRIGITGIAALSLWMFGCQGGGSDESANSSTSSPKSNVSAPDVSKDNPCTLLTPQQVVEAVGLQPVMREIVDEVTCSYEFAETADTQMPSAEAQTKSEQEEAEAMAKDFAVGASGGTPKFSYTIHWEDGQIVIAATRMANQMLGSEMENAFIKLEGIGDEAWLGPLASTLVLRKGDIAVEMDLRLLPQGKERGPRLAKAIADRL